MPDGVAENCRDLVHNLMRITVPVAGEHRLHCRHGVFDVGKSPTTYALTSTASSYLENDSVAHVPKDFRCYIYRVLEHPLHFALNIGPGLNSSGV